MQIDYPFQLDRFGRTATTSEREHVRDLLEQLLLTAPGERVNRPDFGSGLRQLVFAPNSLELAAALQYTIQAALQRWLGDVMDVEALEIVADESALRVLVRYSIRRTGEQVEALVTRPVPGGQTT